MNFIQSISTCMRKYITFSGRATRSEFWWFYFFTVLVNFAASFVGNLIFMSTYNIFFIYLSTITSLILLLPSLAVAVRRLHDVGRSGWWILIAFSVIGIIPLLIWYVTDTKDEENVYGQKEPGQHDSLHHRDRHWNFADKSAACRERADDGCHV